MKKKFFIVLSLLVASVCCLFAEIGETTLTDNENKKHTLSWVVDNDFQGEYSWQKNYWAVSKIARFDKPYIFSESVKYKLYNQEIVSFRVLDDIKIIQAILEDAGYVYDFYEWAENDKQYFRVVEFFMINKNYDLYCRWWDIEQ